MSLEKDIDEFLKQNGLGDGKEVTTADIRKAVAKIIAELDKKNEKSFEFHMKNYHR